MKSIQSFMAALAVSMASAIASAPAHAVDYVGATFANAAAGNSVGSYGSGNSQSFDINFAELGEVTLEFVTQGVEPMPAMSLNALVNNFSGFNIDGLIVTLSGGAVFSVPYGTVSPTFGTIGTTSVMPTQVSSYLSSGEGYAIKFGNPYAEAGLSDWTIDYSAVNSGGTFSVTVAAVPEPETYALMLAGLALLGAITRHRRK